jgi:peptidyl-prolyl cis-trans isomerase B (cyclophilin B)
MPKLRAVLILAAVLLCGCDHHNRISNEGAGEDDSQLTGIPAQPLNSTLKTPPRATLVALPPTAAMPATSAAPSAITTEAVASTPAAPASNPNSSATNAAPAETSLPPTEPTPTASADMPGSTAAAPSSSTAEPGQSSTAASSSGPSGATAAPDANQDKLVIIDTTYGRIIIALDDFAAPKTCKNFRQLIQDGFYNNTVFHRVIPNFIIQGGDPNSKSSATNRNTYGLGGPGYTIPAEINLKHDRGAVAMARLPDSLNPQRESNGSQFYICLAPCSTLDDQYTVFGHVIQGMDVADKIAEAPRDQRDNPLARVQMTVSLESKEQALGAGSAANP